MSKMETTVCHACQKGEHHNCTPWYYYMARIEDLDVLSTKGKVYCKCNLDGHV